MTLLTVFTVIFILYLSLPILFGGILVGKPKSSTHWTGAEVARSAVTCVIGIIILISWIVTAANSGLY